MNRLPRSLVLQSDALGLTLRADTGLSAMACRVGRGGQQLPLAGPEVEVDLDAAERRLWITGWRGMDGAAGAPPPHAEEGFRRGWQHPECDDAKWYPMLNPTLLMGRGGPQYYWARAHVFVPADCAGRPLILVVGGIGLFDYRWMRAFVNGHPVATRRYRGLWHEPLRAALDPRRVRFGQDNVIALQMREPVRRSARLDAVDPRRTRAMPHTFLVPPQFEQYVAVGGDTRRAGLRVARIRGQAVTLRSPELVAEIRYRFASGGAVLAKRVTLRNTGRAPLRVMRVGLGRYAAGAPASPGDQGFPVYAGGFFLSLAHPAGWAMGQGRSVELRQYPGVTLAPGATWRSMDAVLGVGGRPEFLRHVRSRMRRVRRGHDRAYAVYETFGSWPIPPGENLGDRCSESILLRQARSLRRAQRIMGGRFDAFNVEFWVDSRGDTRRAAPDRFPQQFRNVRRALRDAGGPPLGLWIDSSISAWNIGGNPVVSACANGDRAHQGPLTEWGTCLCRASEPLRSMFADGFRHHLRANGARLFKFDNLQALCYNPAHDHLPGLYSTEAIMNAVVDFLGQLDRACPDVFLMLYWGHRSPWWLRHADTLFEPGLCVEAATPSPSPSLFARDGVTLGLDQAHRFAEDIPPLGKDSLGVWLSEWPWNSGIGAERWQEGFVMDMCRGSLLAQPWGDLGRLSAEELRQLGAFVRLLRAHPECFSRPRPIGGDPWKSEPHGYCCAAGGRAFVAFHNCTWNDAVLDVAAATGLDVHSRPLYRWWPRPARLARGTRRLALRPFEVVLLELPPPGRGPALDDVRFPAAAAPDAFAEASRPLPLRARRDGSRWRVAGRVPPSAAGGGLVISAERTRRGEALLSTSPGKDFAARVRLAGRPVPATPVLGPWTHGCSWQAWRAAVPPGARARTFAADVSVAGGAEVGVRLRAHWIPLCARGAGKARGHEGGAR